MASNGAWWRAIPPEWVPSAFLSSRRRYLRSLTAFPTLAIFEVLRGSQTGNRCREQTGDSLAVGRGQDLSDARVDDAPSAAIMNPRSPRAVGHEHRRPDLPGVAAEHLDARQLGAVVGIEHDQLDTAGSTCQARRKVVEAIEGRTEVAVDGGHTPGCGCPEGPRARRPGRPGRPALSVGPGGVC